MLSPSRGPSSNIEGACKMGTFSTPGEFKSSQRAHGRRPRLRTRINERSTIQEEPSNDAPAAFKSRDFPGAVAAVIALAAAALAALGISGSALTRFARGYPGPMALCLIFLLVGGYLFAMARSPDPQDPETRNTLRTGPSWTHLGVAVAYAAFVTISIADPKNKFLPEKWVTLLGPWAFYLMATLIFTSTVFTFNRIGKKAGRPGVGSALPVRLSWKSLGAFMILGSIGVMVLVGGQQLGRRDVPTIDLHVDEPDAVPTAEGAAPPVAFTNVTISARTGGAPIGARLLVVVTGMESAEPSACTGDLSRPAVRVYGARLLTSEAGAADDGTIRADYSVDIPTDEYSAICVTAVLAESWFRESAAAYAVIGDALSTSSGIP